MLINPLNRTMREHEGIPVLPGAFPFLGHLPAMVFNLGRLFEYAGRTCGSHFWVEFGSIGRLLVCNHPDAFDLLKNKSTSSAFLTELAPAFGHAMVMLDGDTHRNMRSLTNESFLPRGLTATGVAELFATVITIRMKEWRTHKRISVVPQARDLSLALAFQMFGIENSEIPAWNRAYRKYFLYSALPISIPGTPFDRGQSAQVWIDNKLTALVRCARENPDAVGLLASIVHAFDQTEGSLNDTQLLDNLRFLILAAHDNVAATLSQILIKLALHPQHWTTLCEEANTVGVIPKSPKDLAQFPFATAFFRETLRLHPSTPLTFRRALVDLSLGGRTLAAGTDFIVPIALLSKHTDVYSNPDEFLPSRWLDHAESIKPIETVQFGGGPHYCLGYHMAWLQMVQFSIALALTMSTEGLRPRLISNPKKGGRYFPSSYPYAKTRVLFS
jgi:cytochrome P450